MLDDICEHIGQSFVAGHDVHDLRPGSSLGSRFAADIDGDCVDRPAFDIHFHAAQTDVRRLMIAAARRTTRPMDRDGLAIRAKPLFQCLRHLYGAPFRIDLGEIAIVGSGTGNEPSKEA